MKTNKEVVVRIPRTPNFIELTPGGYQPVQTFTDKELRAIAKVWTKNLLKDAQKKRDSGSDI